MKTCKHEKYKRDCPACELVKTKVVDYVTICPNCKKLVSEEECTNCEVKPIKVDIDKLDGFLL